jgi:uncharacterized membrane protein (UPF0136 family)
MLAIFFGIRYSRSRKLMPAGIMTVLSLLTIVLLLTHLLG